ncbi:DUF3606 domain-containing protein [Brevundimonas diminuta]|uniref:DUF3606 domain-containing protein n=1 Tax=Brevundimonas diminuta TaxID=293 RepID=UPI0035E13C3E
MSTDDTFPMPAPRSPARQPVRKLWGSGLAAKFGVSEERLRAAVQKVGDQADAVERELKGG